MKYQQISINPDILKIVALITMTIDHLFKYFPFLPFTDTANYLGRISFPIFSVLIMKHLSEKQIFKKYLIRLGGFGLLSLFLLLPFQGKISENPAFPFNILISFFVAIATIKCYQILAFQKLSQGVHIAVSVLIFLYFGFFSLMCQYSIFGFLFLICLYLYFEKKNKIYIIPVLIFSALINPEGVSWLISLSVTLFLLSLNQTEKHPRLIKKWWIFYTYYPLHLLLFASIAYFMGQQ